LVVSGLVSLLPLLFLASIVVKPVLFLGWGCPMHWFFWSKDLKKTEYKCIKRKKCYITYFLFQDNFKLDNFVNFSSFSSPPPNLEDGEVEIEGEDFLAEKIGTLLHNGLYLNLRDKVVNLKDDSSRKLHRWIL
jgi:hypothetical protein